MKSQNRKNTVRKPVEIYKQCPVCKSKDLISIAVDVICGECDWMSCEEHVQSGGMDDLVAAFCEHFAVAPEAVKFAEVIVHGGESRIRPNLFVQPAPIEIEEPCEIEAIA